MNPGDRVGAICDANQQRVRFFGYGVYRGDEMGSPLPFPNPKIELDNGKIVWGCQCWWDAEDNIKQALEGRTVELIDIDNLLAAHETTNEPEPESTGAESNRAD